MPRARLNTADGRTTEWKSKVLPAYQPARRQCEALIAGTYLAGTNTRRVRRALAALFKGAIGKDAVSRIWRKVKTDWEAWSKRPLDAERHRPADPRRHRRARPARQEGDVDLAAGRPRRPPRRPEGAAGGEEHGRRERGRLAGAARRPGRPRAEDARIPDRRRRRRPGEGAGGAVAGGADPALHGSQAPEPARPRARAAARRDLGRLHRHDLRRDAEGDRGAAQGLPAQVAAEVPGGRRQPGGSR